MEILNDRKYSPKHTWAKLDGDVREYLEQIIACNEETEEMRDLLNESLTQVSFDDVFSSFLDALSVEARA